MADNMDLEKCIALEETIEEPESIAMELLHEFKEHNKRMDDHNKRLIGAIKTVSISFALAVAAIVSAFLLYMYQYDFQNYSQDGSYNNINNGTQGDVNNGEADVDAAQEEGR